jgi:hypothetical protein
MRIFDELQNQYDEIDNNYAAIEFDAITKGQNNKESKYKRKRELNDQAYFLFMFSRLEDRIRKQSSILIARKQASISSWKQRAAWDILPTGASGSEISFKNRLALLTSKNSTDYTLIVGYYKERNSIAHGGSFVSLISMPTVISELKRLYPIIKAY